MKKVSTFIFLIVFAVSFPSLKAQNIQFEYDNAGNCIVKYKTIVLRSDVKSNDKDSDNLLLQSDMISGRKIIIYPNPTKSYLKINITGKIPENPIQYLLTDLNGKIIFKVQSLDMFYLFDISAFPSGIYLLRITIDNKWSKWKIIKE